MQAGEELQPEDDSGSGSDEEADELLVAQLVSMGFPESKCKRAALSTGNKGNATGLRCMDMLAWCSISIFSRRFGAGDGVAADSWRRRGTGSSCR